MLKVAFNLNRMAKLFGGDFRPVLDIAALADRKGVDQLVIGDHLALNPDGYGNYPHGTFPNKVDAFMVEGATALAAVAAVTRHARLSWNVLISPLRSAVLLAKQLGMIDVISGGRLDASLGAGWLKEEFEAAEMPFDNRFSYMEEQVEVCRTLWSTAPASFHGRRVRFNNLYVLPQPPQGAKLPVWLGFSMTERGLDRIVRLADGWATPPMPDDKIASDIEKLHAALRAAGRDPATFPIRSQLYPVRRADNSIDLDASFLRAEKLQKMGVTMVSLVTEHYCETSSDVEPMIDRLLSLRVS